MWALATPGGREDFPELVRLLAAGGSGRRSPPAVRLLWSLRSGLGRLFGWDDAGEGTPTLRERLGPDLLAAPPGPAPRALPFTPLYQLEDEWAGEIANRTMHGVIHLGWVPADGGYRGQMAVLVRPNGLLGRAYMAAIRPARHLIVYPAMLRRIEGAWAARGERRSAPNRSLSTD